MRYSDYDKQVFNDDDLTTLIRHFQDDIEKKQKDMSDFIDRANERIKYIKECEEEKRYRIVGHLFKNGKSKQIIFIIRYDDGSQRTERYSFAKISDLRKKLDELRDIHSGVDWSEFTEEF